MHADTGRERFGARTATARARTNRRSVASGRSRSPYACQTRFNADSTASGLNYERVQGTRDRKLRSLRIDGSYRATVSKPGLGNTHIPLWADKHDEAYEWARRHRCDINPQTGAIQVYEPESVEHAQPHATHGEYAAVTGGPARLVADSDIHPRAFQDPRDLQLTRLGVPTAMLSEVRLSMHHQRAGASGPAGGPCAKVS